MGEISVCLSGNHWDSLLALSIKLLLHIIAFSFLVANRMTKEKPSSSPVFRSAQQPASRLWLSKMYNGPLVTPSYHPFWQIRLWWPAKGEGLNTLTPMHKQWLPSQQGSGKWEGGWEKASPLSNAEKKMKTHRLPLHVMMTHSGGAHLLPLRIMHASPGDCLPVPVLSCLDVATRLRHRDVQWSNGDGFFFS